MEHAELGQQTIGGRFLACEFLHQGVGFQSDFGHLLGLQVVLLAQLHAGIDGRVNHNAASKWLVGVEFNFPRGAQVFCDFLPIGFVRKHLHQTTRRFQSAG